MPRAARSSPAILKCGREGCCPQWALAGWAVQVVSLSLAQLREALGLRKHLVRALFSLELALDEINGGQG